MQGRIGARMLGILVVLGSAAWAWGQGQPWQGADPARRPVARPAQQQPPVDRRPVAGRSQRPADPRSAQARPPQPSGRRVPQAAPRARSPQAYAKAPFPPLTPPQQEYLDRVLKAWEAKSNWIKTFEAPFTRYEYDSVWAMMHDPDYPRTGILKAKFVDLGSLKFKKPDKGYFRVDGDRPEQWICDGKSIFVYDFARKRRSEYPLPPHMQGKAIEDGPLPFLFDSSAEKLKARFWVRAVQPPPGARDQAWLEAYPRRHRDAKNFRRADLILNYRTMLPVAIQLHDPNGKIRTSYVFDPKRIVVNDPNPLRFLKGNPFSADSQTPRGWKKLLQREMATRMWGGAPKR